MPPYAFVPGGPWPHPTASPHGHGAGIPREPAPPIEPGAWERSPAYLRGIALFNAGYYWEAHESWEALWLAHGRRGPTADVLRALIKLAAAGVKVRVRQPHGVRVHARRASGLFAAAQAAAGRRQLGLDLDEAAAVASRIADAPPTDPGQPGDRVVRVFRFTIAPGCAPSPSFPERAGPPADDPSLAPPS
jgi:hypothetical protein